MNQGCKFTDQERLRVPRPAPSLCVRQQLFGLAARWAARAVLVTAPKVGMQGFLQLLAWIQSLFSSHQQCSRPSTHFHSSKLHNDTRRGLKAVNSSLNLSPLPSTSTRGQKSHGWDSGNAQDLQTMVGSGAVTGGTEVSPHPRSILASAHSVCNKPFLSQ